MPSRAHRSGRATEEGGAVAFSREPKDTFPIFCDRSLSAARLASGTYPFYGCYPATTGSITVPLGAGSWETDRASAWQCICCWALGLRTQADKIRMDANVTTCSRERDKRTLHPKSTGGPIRLDCSHRARILLLQNLGGKHCAKFECSLAPRSSKFHTATLRPRNPEAGWSVVRFRRKD